jgi:hypothetical protein
MYMSNVKVALMQLEQDREFGISRRKEDLNQRLREALVKLRGVFDILADEG